MGRFFCGFKIDHPTDKESREKEIIIKRYVVMKRRRTNDIQNGDI
jgi:hypothetical protein